MSEPDELLGEVIRARRRDELGLSQEGLAAAASLSRGHVGRIERGATSLSFPTLVKLAAALGLTPADLVRRYDLAAEKSSSRKGS
jgi:transcriptional regulator with XRE-family HTH domain